MSERGRTNAVARLKVDPREAQARAALLRNDPKVKAWMKRARRLFKDLPSGTRIYWQESEMNLMALSPEGWAYINEAGAGEAQDAVVASIDVPGSDCGGW